MVNLLAAGLCLIVLAGAGWAATKVSLEPVEDRVLDRILAQAYVLPMVLDLPGATPQKTKTLIAAEARRLRDILRSRGYLRATVNVIRNPPTTDSVRLQPVPGHLYRIGWIRTMGLPAAMSEEALAALDAFSAAFVGQTATRDNLDQIETGVIWRLRESSFAAGEVVRVDQQLETAIRVVGLSITIAPGSPVHLGKVRLLGSKHADLFSNVASSTIKEGSPYSAEAIEQLRKLLEQTALFRRVDLSLAGSKDAIGLTAVDVALADKLPDQQVLQQRAGLGAVLSIVTMLLIVLRECAGARANWFGRPVGPALSGIVVVFYAVNMVVILQVLYVLISFDIR